ncbi:hypothetical protein [Mycolicibacterium nivoides]|uniref:Uncharacterized protein n=1 Tax=Mycolicibacterium nivoides TaxID=2487344 RepID=A0ABW9LBQ7_9MYCO
MVSNRVLEAVKRLLTADTYFRSRDQSADRGGSTTDPARNPESRSATATDLGVSAPPEVS